MAVVPVVEKARGMAVKVDLAGTLRMLRLILRRSRRIYSLGWRVKVLQMLLNVLNVL